MFLIHPLVNICFNRQSENIHVFDEQPCLYRYLNQNYLNTRKYCSTNKCVVWKRSIIWVLYFLAASFPAGYLISQWSWSFYWRSPSCVGGCLTHCHCWCWSSLSWQYLGYKRRYSKHRHHYYLSPTIMLWSAALKVITKQNKTKNEAALRPEGGGFLSLFF